MICFATLNFKTGQNDFQKTLKSGLKKIQSSKNVLVFTDKTANFYDMSPDHYNSLLSKDFNVKLKENPIIKICTGVYRQNSKSL